MTAFDGRGVLPASTTPFDRRGQVDQAELVRHIDRLLRAGCDGVVVLGSLGEGASLSNEERGAIVRTAVRSVRGRAPAVAAVASPRTAEAVELARRYRRLGVDGLMVLPQYVYRGDERENLAHVREVLEATDLPCLLYNNPVAYGVDFRPADIAELVRRCPNLIGVKESSGIRERIRLLRRRLPRSVSVVIGLDDQVLPAARDGAEGWVAGLANPLPKESVALWARAREGPRADADRLFRWFLPLLRMDAHPKFVQMIKEVERAVGAGNGRVRPPRRPLHGVERDRVRRTIRTSLRARRPEYALRTIR